MVARQFQVDPKTVKAIYIRCEAREKRQKIAQLKSLGGMPSSSVSAAEGESSQLMATTPNKIGPMFGSVPENILLAKYIKFRQGGKSCLDCVVELKLVRGMGEKLENDYACLKDLKQAFIIAEKLIKERVDYETFINEVKDASIASYIEKIAEKKAGLQDLEKLVAEVDSEYQSLLENKQNCAVTISNLKKQTEILLVKKEDVERQVNEVKQKRDLILRECNQIKADCELECCESGAKLREGSTKYIHDLLKNDNDNPKLEALAAAIVLAFRRKSDALYGLLFIDDGPTAANQAAAFVQNLRWELLFAVYLYETVYHQVFKNGTTQFNSDAKSHDNVKPSPTVILNMPQPMPVPSESQLDKTLRSALITPPPYEPSALDRYAKECIEEQRKKRAAATDSSPSDGLALRPTDSSGFSFGPSSATCGIDGKCSKVTRTD
jgi:hypothetical protein